MRDQRAQEEYFRRIHKVQDYIENHIDCRISIETLAEVAGFSKYHFSRIFQSLLRESLAHYVNRIRMEKTLFYLAHRQDRTMTDIAYDLGFSDSAVFSRAFKNYYGISPSQYRMTHSKNCKESVFISDYNKSTAEKDWVREPSSVTGEIRFETLKPMEVAYVRHIGTYESLAKEYPHLLQVLFNEAMRQDLLGGDDNWLLAMYHDHPIYGDEKQFRTSICLTVPEGREITEEGVLGKMELTKGLYAVGNFQIQQSQYTDAWDYMYREWIAGSGYVPRNGHPFEVYRNDASKEKDHVHHVDIYVPVEPICF